MKIICQEKIPPYVRGDFSDSQIKGAIIRGVPAVVLK
jgi:hypothetical protein